MGSFLLNNENFNDTVEKFKKFVADKNEDEYVSFNKGWLDNEEGYKKKIPSGAYEFLDTSTWDKKWIGTGKILKRVIEVLDYKPPGDFNNLVDWRRKDNLNAIIIHDAKKTKKIESLVYRLYSERNTDDEIFDKLADITSIGGNYDLISYLFFLKNSRRYLPNRPKSFEKAFALLGEYFVFRMSKRCNWTNYSEYLNRMSEIRELLQPKFEEKISLIDAHSFCWVIAHNPKILEIDLNSSISEPPQLIITESPFVSPDEKFKPKEPRKFHGVLKTERESNERNNNIIGLKGEEYVRDAEKQLLIDNGRSDLAENVDHVSVTNGDGVGYDIKSFSLDGGIKYIEVKTTNSDKNAKFFISENELAFSEQNPEKYYIYRLYNFNQKSKKNACYIIQGNMREKLMLCPTSYDAFPLMEK
jgi:hypothetical protein